MIEYFLAAFFAAGGPDGGAPVAAVAPADFKNPINISADRFEIQGRRQEAVWVGNVKAERGRTVLTCARLIAHYTRTQEITRIECVGTVEATHGDMWAKGERADFDNVTGILVVTGNPQASKGPNKMAGTKITFDVTRETISVENARTIFETESTRLKTPPSRPRR